MGKEKMDQEREHNQDSQSELVNSLQAFASARNESTQKMLSDEPAASEQKRPRQDDHEQSGQSQKKPLTLADKVRKKKERSNHAASKSVKSDADTQKSDQADASADADQKNARQTGKESGAEYADRPGQSAKDQEHQQEKSETKSAEDRSAVQANSVKDSLETSARQRKEEQKDLSKTAEEKEEALQDSSETETDDSQESPDWTEQLALYYTKNHSIWIRPWIYILTAAALVVLWAVADMTGLGLYAFSHVAMILGLGALVLGGAGFLFFMQRKWFLKVFAVILCILVSAAGIMQIQANEEMATDVRKMTNPGTPVSISSAIYYLKQAPVASVESLSNNVVGVLSKNKEVNQMVLDSLEDKDIHLRTKTFDSFSSLLKALKGQAIRAVILTGTDPLLASEFPDLADTRRELAVLEAFPETKALYNKASDLDPASDPFVMLISAQLDELNNPESRSDLNMLVAVNPDTHTLLNVYIPRSTKLPVVCEDGLGCLPDEQDKLSLTSYHSILALKQTLGSALDTTVDFTAQVDLSWLIQGLSGQEEVPVSRLGGYGSLSYPESAQQTLTGITARRLMTDIDDFSATDAQYEVSQFDLLMYLLQSYMQKSSQDLKSVLNDLSQCVSTSFSYEQLLRLISLFAMHDYVWSNYGCGIAGSESWEISPSLEAKAFMMSPDSDSLDQAAMDIKAVLNGDTPQFAASLDPRTGALIEVEDDTQKTDDSADPDSQTQQPSDTASDQSTDTASDQSEQTADDQSDASVQTDESAEAAEPVYEDPGIYNDPAAYEDPGVYYDPAAYEDPEAYYDPSVYDPYGYYGQ